MPVPLNISELSTTPGSNSPSGSDSPSVLDDHQRTAYAFIKTLSDTKASSADAVLLTGNQTIAGTKTFSSTPVVPDDSFGFAKLQNVATGTILGRTTAGTGNIEELASAAAFTAIKQAATETATGVVELATNAETQAGTDTTRAITAANLKAAQVQIGTAVTLTTQTSVDFTGIPSWVKRITVMFSAVSGNGTSAFLIQLGDSGGIEATGYVSSASSNASAATSTTGFIVTGVVVAATSQNGAVVLSRIDTNSWVSQGSLGFSNASSVNVSGGSKTLSDTLTQIRITTVNGTDQFDAGVVNISYE